MFKPQKLESVRARNAALKAEREALQNALPHEDDVHVQVLGHVRKIAAEMGGTLRARLQTGDVNRALRVRPHPDGTIDVMPILVHVMGPDALTDVLVRHLPSTPDALTEAQRRARLAEIEGELYSLELEEERQIEASEAAGTPAGHRPDADPRAVLGERE